MEKNSLQEQIKDLREINTPEKEKNKINSLQEQIEKLRENNTLENKKKIKELTQLINNLRMSQGGARRKRRNTRKKQSRRKK